MVVRAYIIDDEAPARRGLRFLLEKVGGVEVVGEAANGTEALKGIREAKPHVIFLDIQMPGLSGLELAPFLCELPLKPLIVFATACQEHAVQAFEVDAIDYLRKPFTLERVARTIAKAARMLAFSTVPPAPEAREAAEPCRKVPLCRGEAIIPTAPDRILFAHAEEGEVIVRTVDGRYRTRFTLNELEQKLALAGFLRTHRGFLVNVNHVREVLPWFNGSYKLIMDDRERSEIPVSRYNVKDLKRHFDL
ncbi:LytR/AlgR family response regulator transcription factor [Geobacter argillaceus]|uniref:LytTR family two component transcriptional regulator n=1 Tax=Geobacter argillaceus TaxID=345631 RepID=A0A562WR51_9BACT|nr:LytTR family DNA-binding domain-containing protein [Geobacter argillaceus]TWJ32819.1 LytTR family two component transcriptional regulator [Geobacter argillaceus]